MKLLVVVLLSCLFLFEGSDARALKRNSGDEPFICSKKTPCGWQVYKPYTRTIDYYIKSPCECPSGTECRRFSDDISISAYEHRCSPMQKERE